MAKEVFTWQRQKGAAGKVQYRVRESQFGDGYSQVIQDGLNNKVQTWPLSFEGGIDYIQPILEFFDRHRGATSFYWTPPGTTEPCLFRVKDITLTSIGGGMYQVSAEFKQVFI